MNKEELRTFIQKHYENPYKFALDYGISHVSVYKYLKENSTMPKTLINYIILYNQHEKLEKKYHQLLDRFEKYEGKTNS